MALFDGMPTTLGLSQVVKEPVSRARRLMLLLFSHMEAKDSVAIGKDSVAIG